MARGEKIMRAVKAPADHERIWERVHARWVSSASGGSIASLVEATRDDARPALESALFVAEVGREAAESSLELHEAAAMWTLLGRLLAAHARTATAGLDYARSILDAIEAEGFDLERSARALLEAVFVEGFVLAREEQAWANAAAEHLAALVPRRVADGVELLILTGPYETDELARALEGWVRRSFRQGTRVALIDLSGARDLDAMARPLRETCLVLVSLGVQAVAVGAPGSLELPEEVEAAASFEEGLARALSARELSGFALARMRRLFGRG